MMRLAGTAFPGEWRSCRGVLDGHRAAAGGDRLRVGAGLAEVPLPLERRRHGHIHLSLRPQFADVLHRNEEEHLAPGGWDARNVQGPAEVSAGIIDAQRS